MITWIIPAYGAGALAHGLQCHTTFLQNPKWPPGGLKSVDQVWKKVQPRVIGPSDQLLLNKFFSCEATLWTAHVCLSVCIYVCHIPFFLVITNSIPSYLKEFHKCYKGVSWVSKGCPNGIPPLGWSLTNPRMVTHQSKDGPPPEGSALQTWNLVFRLNPKTNTSWQLLWMVGHHL